MARTKETESDAVAAFDREIRDFIEKGRWEEALEIAAHGLAEHPESEILARWKDLLTPRPPRLTGEATGKLRDEENAWLRAHAREYEGQWVVLEGGTLVAVGSGLQEVSDEARKTGRRLADMLFVFLPPDRPWVPRR